jgi:hypothetical protein
MSQHIGVAEVDERNNIIAQSEANFADVQKSLTTIKGYNNKFPTLSKIDEYGNTTFNYLQLPNVVSELDSLSKIIAEPATKTEIAKIQSFIGYVKTSKYIKFIGD